MAHSKVCLEYGVEENEVSNRNTELMTPNSANLGTDRIAMIEKLYQDAL